jgi:hypothetical protein
VDFLRLYIPSNVFYALSNAIVPAVVVFSILFGVALIQVPRKERLLDMLSTAGETLMRVTAVIGRLAPYGVFAITAAAAGTIDVGDLARLQVYLVLHASLALPFLLDLLRLPADLFQVFITMDVVAARFGTLAAGMHVIALALVGAYAMQGQLRFDLKRVLGFVLISLVLLAAVLLGIRAFYKHVFVAPSPRMRC